MVDGIAERVKMKPVFVGPLRPLPRPYHATKMNSHVQMGLAFSRSLYVTEDGIV